MKVIPPNIHELAFKQCQRLLMMNPLMMSTYYTTLFTTFRSLLTEDDSIVLDYHIKNIEGWLSDDLNKMTLQEAELRMYNNMDLLSGFLVRGSMITQMEIQQKLEEVKTWLTQRLYTYMYHIRFTQNVTID